MNPDIVVDVGNTRIKWGRCDAGGVTAIASLSDDPAAWQKQLEAWNVSTSLSWLLSGVHPERRDALGRWLHQHDHAVRVVTEAKDLPVRTVKLEYPDRAGIDRLLNAVAANARRRPNQAAALIDAGSAVTVDFLDIDGSFRGGAIFPGVRLMFKALHDYTALLPLTDLGPHLPAYPGTTTPTAMQAGVFAAVTGGIDALIHQMREARGDSLAVFVTGGDAALLAPGLRSPAVVWPEMTLEGVRRTALQLP